MGKSDISQQIYLDYFIFCVSNFVVVAVQELFMASLNILHFLEDIFCHLQ